MSTDNISYNEKDGMLVVIPSSVSSTPSKLLSQDADQNIGKLLDAIAKKLKNRPRTPLCVATIFVTGLSAIPGASVEPLSVALRITDISIIKGYLTFAKVDMTKLKSDSEIINEFIRIVTGGRATSQARRIHRQYLQWSVLITNAELS